MLRSKTLKTPSFMILSLLAGACFVAGISGCKKSNTDAPVMAVISTVSPESGPYATVVTISGSGFSTTPANNIVQFNHVAATVQQATSTQLTVVVPKQAGTGQVTVQVGSNTATGPVFTYDYTAVVTTFAGSGTAGSANGTGTAAQFHAPNGLSFDGQGNLVVADLGNNMIRKISPSGSVTTWAGSTTGGYMDSSNGLDAKFFNPSGIQVDAAGNGYVSDQSNEVIRKITTAGAVTTFAGNTTTGYKDGAATIAEFFTPMGLAMDTSGNLYVADWANSLIRKVTSAGMVSTFAGNLNIGLVNGNGTAAEFYRPTALAFDKNGNLYVADSYNDVIRKITSTGTVSTLAGNGKKGYADGTGDSAQFNIPSGLAVDANGNVYVADFGNSRVRMITPAGVVSTVAGSGTSGIADGIGVAAQFKTPQAVAIDAKGNIYIADYSGNNIRMITME